MKLTLVLKRQHIGFMFKKHWLIQGKRVPIDTGVEEHLKSMNIPVVDALDFIKENSQQQKFKYVGLYDEPLPLDENHPDYKTRPCYMLKNTNVLLEGISQAQVLTKTVIADGLLPHKIEDLAKIELKKNIHEYVKKTILSANVFDCEQKKLPKKKDPKRPAYNFPRILGITDRRRNMIITNKLLLLAERTSNIEEVNSKYINNDVKFQTTFEKEQDLIQFQELSNILVTGSKPLKYEISHKDISFVEIPDLYPVKHTVTLPPEHFYTENSAYPIQPTVSKKYPHTTWLHYNSTEISNIYETPVTRIQQLGRALTHAFTVAAAYAKQNYGEHAKDLPEPLYINCIQTDGQTFHFGVLELNTLDLNGKEGTKNVWYMKNDLKMYESSKYLGGMPVLEKYNPEVYSYINAFYNS